MGLTLATAGIVKADEPRPVPLTRPEMKQFLEDMKARKPRIPLPELTEDEKAKLGEREIGYENRLRTLYLPEGWGFGGGAGGNRAGSDRERGRRRAESERGRRRSRGGPGPQLGPEHVA